MYVNIDSSFPIATTVEANGGAVTTSMYNYGVANIVDDAKVKPIAQPMTIPETNTFPTKAVPVTNRIPIKETVDVATWVSDHKLLIGAIGVGILWWFLHRR